MFGRMGLICLVCVGAVALPSGNALACGGGYHLPAKERTLAESLVRLSTLTATKPIDRNGFKSLIDELRSHGQSAVDQMIKIRGEIAASIKHKGDHRLRIWDYAIDRVSGQKSATESRLFWHTSLPDACAESSSSGRPILSLRLLGRLDKDRSCANSRFFRGVLYPDPAIAEILREHFVLHWQSVCDVPIVTIQFSGNRKLQQPLVGNSVHLLLDSQGHPVDALPGLVAPTEFRVWLADVNRLWNNADSPNFWSLVVDYHRDRAARRRMETPLAIGKDQSVGDLNPLDRRWYELAMKQNHRLDVAGRARLQRGQPPIAERAMVTAPSKSRAETPMFRMVSSFEQTISRDTVFNLYALQTKIDDRFAAMQQPPEYDRFTSEVYADIFLMPLDDPWLGLSPRGTYTALDGIGRIDLSVYNDK